MTKEGAKQTFTLPPDLLLEIDHRCNCRCPWCYCVWHEGPERKMRNLPLETWKKIIALSIAKGARSFMFSGGEATLRDGWQELLSFTREHLPEGEISLFTNGSRLTEEDLLLCRGKRVWITVSLQGLRTYAAMTGTRRSYERILQLLMRAGELHHPCGVSITVTRANLFEVEDVYSAAALTGASAVQINAMMFAGRAENRSDLAVPPEEWHALKARMAKVVRDGVPVAWGEEISCVCEHPPEERAEWRLADLPPCPAGKRFGVFGPDGYFRRCLHTKEKLFYWKDYFGKEVRE